MPIPSRFAPPHRFDLRRRRARSRRCTRERKPAKPSLPRPGQARRRRHRDGSEVTSSSIVLEPTAIATPVRRPQVGRHGRRARLLLPHSPIGTVKVGTPSTVIKYVYARTTPDGRFITVVTGSPIGFVGAGAPGAKMKIGLRARAGDARGPGEGPVTASSCRRQGPPERRGRHRHRGLRRRDGAAVGRGRKVGAN